MNLTYENLAKIIAEMPEESRKQEIIVNPNNSAALYHVKNVTINKANSEDSHFAVIKIH